MRNPLQEQLLKAGLVKKSRVAEVVREQNRQRHGKSAPPAAAHGDTERIDTAKLQAERAERDRALAEEQKERARAREVLAQVRQIVECHRVESEGEIAHRFRDGEAIRSVLVDQALRTQLAKGLLVIVRHHDGYALLPRSAAEKVRARDPAMIVLDHAGSGPERDDEDPYYQQFRVPDDLVW